MWEVMNAQFGEHLWWDALLLSADLIAIIVLIVYAVKRYGLRFPRIQPLALISVGYWLTGMLFASVHGIVWYFNHEAYNGLKDHSNFEFVYFSFVTLTTLGFGDVYPVSPIARWLSVFEACVGIFFVAVLIAILIGAKPKAH